MFGVWIEMINWIDVNEKMPPYNKPVMVYCKDAPYKYDLLKMTIASFLSKEELEQTHDDYDGQGEDWYAEVSLFNSDYGSYLMGEKVTHWAEIENTPE